ncbi:MAG: hypothetical protein MZV64_02060 [Ignavibacteriales bacterium]|nr:hypothetical protein [Ignavibacteriales bacterium]
MPFIDLLFNQSPAQPGTEVSFSIFNLKEWLSYQLNEFVQSYSKLATCYFIMCPDNYCIPVKKSFLISADMVYVLC